MNARYVAFVRHEDAPLWLALGWLNSGIHADGAARSAGLIWRCAFSPEEAACCPVYPMGVDGGRIN